MSASSGQNSKFLKLREQANLKIINIKEEQKYNLEVKKRIKINPKDPNLETYVELPKEQESAEQEIDTIDKQNGSLNDSLEQDPYILIQPKEEIIQAVSSYQQKEIPIKKKPNVKNEYIGQQQQNAPFEFSTNNIVQAKQLLEEEEQQVGKFEEKVQQSVEQRKKKNKIQDKDDFIPFNSDEVEDIVDGELQFKAIKEQIFVKESVPKQRRWQRPPIQKVAKIDDLGIFKVKQKFLDALADNQVVILTGETGCGKSTQVPQIIYNDHIQNNRPVKIICTQPRRIAAITLSTRVSNEMGIGIGTLVGYHVGMDAVINEKTKIEFVTTGIFLQRLVYQREKFFEEYTHIIMDEVHERDLDIDFGFIIVKHFLQDFDQVKLILMSATICCEKFSNYFSQNSIANIHNEEIIQKNMANYLAEERRMKAEESGWTHTQQNFGDQKPSDWGLSVADLEKQSQLAIELEKKDYEMRKNREKGVHFLVGNEDRPAPIISINSKRNFVIDLFYLDDLHTFFSPFRIEMEPIRFQNSMFSYDNPKIQENQIDAFKKFLAMFYRVPKTNQLFTKEQQNGSILVFLPGYQEIMDTKELIINEFGEDKFNVVILHSSLTTSPKELMSVSSARSKRRIILSTNIAESSITVPDCLIVIDFCLTKVNIIQLFQLIQEIQYNPRNLLEKLTLQYCSKASSNQRMGRVGRVFGGYCIRLIPKELYETKFSEYTVCEMLRCPLEKIILRIKKTNQIELDSIDEKQEGFKIEAQQPKIRIRRRHIFANVEVVLSTAMDPPSLSQIGHATRNLQSLGALKVLPNQFDGGEILGITKMGLFMCEMPIDIFLTKFIVLSCLLNCPIEGVTIASILSQKKNFFSHAFKRDQVNFLNTLYWFENGDEDDLLIQLRIFMEWENRFFKPHFLTWTENDNYRKKLKRFVNSSYSEEEGYYAKARAVDIRNLKEVLILKHELLMRLKEDFTVDDQKEYDPYDPDFIMLIKTVFAGSFYQKAILVSQDPSKDIEKRVHLLKTYNVNTHLAILLESAHFKFHTFTLEQKNMIAKKFEWVFNLYYEQNSLHHSKILRDAVMIDVSSQNDKMSYNPVNLRKTQQSIRDQAKNWVKRVLLHQDLIIIEFTDDQKNFTHVIKRLLHETEILKRQKRKQEQFTPDWQRFCNFAIDPIEIIQKLQCLVYNCGLGRMQQVQGHKEIGCDIDSINHIQITFGESFNFYDQHLTSYDIQEKDGSKRNLARQSSRMFWTSWMQICAMIFGCNVKVFQDQTHYTKALVNGCEFHFDYFIMEDELMQINSLREMIKTRLLNHEWNLLFNKDIWSEIKQLKQPRTKIQFRNQEKWQEVFEMDQTEKLKTLRDETRKAQQVIRKNKIRGLYNQNNQPNAGKHLDNFKQIFAGELGGFMTPIETQQLQENFEQISYFNDEGIKLYSQLNQLYRNWKQSQLNYLRRKEMQGRMSGNTILVCKECEEWDNLLQVGITDNLRYLTNASECLKQSGPLENFELQWLQGAIQELQMNNFNDNYLICERADHIEEFVKDPIISNVFIKMKLPLNINNYAFFTCPKGLHIFGFYLKNYISDLYSVSKILLMNSKLKLIYYNLQEEIYNMRKIKLEQIKDKQHSIFSEVDLKLQKEQYYCKVCVSEVTFTEYFLCEGKISFLKHCSSQAHRDNIEQLRQTLL